MAARSKKATKQLRLPPGLSPAEEAEWWDAHPEYWDGPDIVAEWIGPLEVRHTQEVKLYLPVDLVATIKEQAARQDRSYQSLIRAWIDAGLAAEGQRT
jgi:hypothetical protein